MKLLNHLNFNNLQAKNLILEKVAGDLGSPQEGGMWYDDTNDRVRVRLNGSTQTLGAAFLADDPRKITIYNGTGGAFAANDLLYIDGWNAANSKFTASKADADAGKPAMFIATGAIADMATGTIQDRFTSAANLDTSAAAAVGDPVYLSTTAGGWTLTGPAGSTARRQVIGRVVVKHASTGQIEFYTGLETVKFGTDDLQDVSITTAKLAATSVTAAKLGSDVAGNGLVGGNGAAIDVNPDGATIEVNSDMVRVKDDGITLAKLKAGASGGVIHTATIGNGSSTSIVVTHNLNKQ
jgi:hypothetical protein